MGIFGLPVGFPLLPWASSNHVFFLLSWAHFYCWASCTVWVVLLGWVSPPLHLGVFFSIFHYLHLGSVEVFDFGAKLATLLSSRVVWIRWSSLELVGPSWVCFREVKLVDTLNPSGAFELMLAFCSCIFPRANPMRTNAFGDCVLL
jgi:hypothetical protein